MVFNSTASSLIAFTVFLLRRTPLPISRLLSSFFLSSKALYESARFPNYFARLFSAASALALFASGSGCFAEESRYAIRDIHHSSWTSESGVSAVFEIQQDSEGYLWLNTANGVVRFDGVRFQSLEDATNNAVRSADIRSVYLAPSGRIWFTTRTADLILLDRGRATVYSNDKVCLSVAPNGGMVEDVDGSLWIEALSGLYHLRGPVSCEQIDESGGYPGGLPAAILIDRKGTVWVKAPSGALLYREKGKSKFELSQYVSGPTSQPAFLHQGPDGSIWLSDEIGLRRLNFGPPPIALSSPPATLRKVLSRFGDFAFTPDGSLWAVVDKGVSRFDDRKWMSKGTVDVAAGESTTRAEGLSSNAIWNLKVDREGSVWVGTNSGLDRLRTTALKTILLPPAEEHEFSLAAGNNGSVWTGNMTLPLTRVDADGRFTSIHKTHEAICVRRDYKGAIWSAADGPVYLWRSSPRGFFPVHYPEEKMAHIVSLAVDRNNDPWINIRPGTTFHLTHGIWRNENKAIGKGIGVLGAMINDNNGIVWLAFAKHLVRWDGTSYQKYSFSLNRFDVSVGTMAARGDHVWLAGAGGIVLFRGGNFYLMEFVDPKLPGRVSGIAETEKGELWANGFTGITHISATELARWLRNPTSKVAAEQLDAFDGLPGLSAERFPEPSVVEASDGRMWFATMKGIAWLDEATLARIRNPMPPPVLVTAVISNGKAYSGVSNLSLPRHTQNLEIDYTALSLAVPERVLFRYRLDGVDKDWQEPGARRQAFYTNLSPGRYTFHVIACNNDGVWNNEGGSFQFSIAPAIYQTNWFLLLCAAVLAFLGWAASQRRVRQAQARAHIQMDERLLERTRIARELHDTLLQSFQGLLLRFQKARNLLPERASEAIHTLDGALDGAERAIVEGRDAIHDLRSSAPAAKGLVEEITSLGEELVAKNGNKDAAQFRVVIEGMAQTLNPNVHIEVFRIAREALRNAVNHSQARRIETEVAYSSNLFRLRIRDDGKGMDSDVKNRGERIGHWGLEGMRERAERLGGELEVWSEPGAGTEVELRIPASIVYESSRAGNSVWLLWKKTKNDHEHLT
jgi:signal transduction histidine kinase/ligand-binding sensor domain-containing protein